MILYSSDSKHLNSSLIIKQLQKEYLMLIESVYPTSETREHFLTNKWHVTEVILPEVAPLPMFSM